MRYRWLPLAASLALFGAGCGDDAPQSAQKKEPADTAKYVAAQAGSESENAMRVFIDEVRKKNSKAANQLWRDYLANVIGTSGVSYGERGRFVNIRHGGEWGVLATVYLDSATNRVATSEDYLGYGWRTRTLRGMEGAAEFIDEVIPELGYPPGKEPELGTDGKPTKKERKKPPWQRGY